MKGGSFWARPCIRGRTGILELAPAMSVCAASGTCGGPDGPTGVRIPWSSAPSPAPVEPLPWVGPPNSRRLRQT
jgi:hypothetical protein